MLSKVHELGCSAVLDLIHRGSVRVTLDLVLLLGFLCAFGC